MNKVTTLVGFLWQEKTKYTGKDRAKKSLSVKQSKSNITWRLDWPSSLGVSTLFAADMCGGDLERASEHKNWDKQRSYTAMSI